MKTLIVLGIILICTAGVTVAVVLKQNTAPSPQVREWPATPIVYVSPETNDTIDVRYATDTARLNGLGYRDVDLVLTESASGAQYQSRKENLILWSKGNEITLHRGRKQIFLGTDANTISNGVSPAVVIPDPLVESNNATSTATTSESETVEEDIATTTEAL